MTQAINNPAHWDQRRQEWVARVEGLISQIADWAQAEGWPVERGQKTIHEKAHSYEVPTLRIQMNGGEVSVNPVGLHVIGAEGRVDLRAMPTLSRVKLVGDGQEWKIITDSNVPIRAPWNRETFVQLAHDLIA